MILVKSVTKTFSSNIPDLCAVDNAFFEVTCGEFILILRRTGSGKSTLPGMIAGLLVNDALFFSKKEETVISPSTGP